MQLASSGGRRLRHAALAARELVLETGRTVWFYPTRSALCRDIPAPAKLNLFLHVTGRRADGYHTLCGRRSDLIISGVVGEIEKAFGQALPHGKAGAAQVAQQVDQVVALRIEVGCRVQVQQVLAIGARVRLGARGGAARSVPHRRGAVAQGGGVTPSA